jgi:hypothetical protein
MMLFMMIQRVVEKREKNELYLKLDLLSDTSQRKNQ